MASITVQVGANQDDGDRYFDSGTSAWVFSNGNNYNRIGSDNQGSGAKDITCFFRFLNVDIPSTATIDSAKLQYKLNSSYSASSKTCKIYADARLTPVGSYPSSVAITSDANLTAAQGDMTTDFTTWSIATSSSSDFLDSADFTDVIDELIKTALWDDGDNNITILLTSPTAAGMMSAYEMQIKAHEVNSGDDAVKLVVGYTEAAATGKKIKPNTRFNLFHGVEGFDSFTTAYNF